MDYTIKKATEKQMDLISDTYWTRAPKWQQNKYHYISFVAVDSDSKIVGYIVLEEKEIPISPYGADWFIETIMVLKPYRCQGIGTALFNHAFAAAKEKGIRNFQGSANPTKEAHSFWMKNRFCFFQYGRQHDDPNKEQEYGNYSHIIFRRVDEPSNGFQKTQTSVPYILADASREQVDRIFTTYIEKDSVKFFHDKKDKINGIVASDASGKTVGFITWLEMPLLSPLSGKQWYIPYLYVEPEARKRGVADILIMELQKMAVQNRIQQLLLIYPNESVMPYWYYHGFDIFVFRYLFNGNDGKFPMGAGKHLCDLKCDDISAL